MTAMTAVSAHDRFVETAGSSRRGTFCSATRGLATAVLGVTGSAADASSPVGRNGVCDSVGSGRSAEGTTNGAGGAGATSVTGAGATRTALAAGFSNVTSNVGGPGGGAGTGGGGGAAAAV